MKETSDSTTLNFAVRLQDDHTEIDDENVSALSKHINEPNKLNFMGRWGVKMHSILYLFTAILLEFFTTYYRSHSCLEINFQFHS